MTTKSKSMIHVKKSNRLLILSLTLLVLLFLHSYGAAASQNNGAQIKAKPNALREFSNFNVTIYFVGDGPADGDELQLRNDGTYHLENEDASDLIPVRLKVNVSGYGCWGECPDYSVNANRTLSEFTVGAIYIIVNDVVTKGGPAISGDQGMFVPVSSGVNVVTVLYLGKDESSGLVWASDTIIVRVQVEQADFDTISRVTVPLTTSITDLVDVGVEFNKSAAIQVSGIFGPSWVQQSVLDPLNNVTLSVDGTEATNGDFLFEASNQNQFALNGFVNTSGFDNYQHLDLHNITQGHLLVLDANGPRVLNGSVTSVDIIAGGLNSVKKTFIGILALNEFGRFSKDQTGHFNADFDGLNSATNSSGDPILSFDASMDFVPEISGAILQSSTGPDPIFNTITLNTTVTSTPPDETVTDTLTETNTLITTLTEDLTTVVEENANGFLALISGIGLFLAYKVRRKSSKQ